MRIFFPNGSIRFPPTRGGDIHRYQLVKELRALGHEVRTLEPDQNPNSEVRPRTPISLLRNLGWADVIYCRVEELPNHATALGSLPWRLLVPKHCTVAWELNVSLKGSPGQMVRSAPEVRQSLRKLARHARRADVAIAVTAALADEARGLLGFREAHAVPNASDPEMFRRDLPRPSHLACDTSRLQVVSIGSMPNSHHDMRLIEELCASIDARRLPIDVHVIGGSVESLQRTRYHSLKVHGPVSYLELPRYLVAMDVGLALYNIPLSTGSPLKLFDYLASGCVPICSPGRAVEDVLSGKDAGFVGPWDADSLCDLLVRLHAEPQRLQRVRENGRRLVVDQHSWRHVAQRTAEILSSASQARRKKSRRWQAGVRQHG